MHLLLQRELEPLNWHQMVKTRKSQLTRSGHATSLREWNTVVKLLKLKVDLLKWCRVQKTCMEGVRHNSKHRTLTMLSFLLITLQPTAYTRRSDRSYRCGHASATLYDWPILPRFSHAQSTPGCAAASPTTSLISPAPHAGSNERDQPSREA